MTDDLDALKAALRPPAPDPAVKAAHLRLAMENFNRLHASSQESASGARPDAVRPTGAGFIKGVRTMLATLTSRPALAATTSIAALCLGVILIAPTFDLTPGSPPAPSPVPKVAEAPLNEAPRTEAQDTDARIASGDDGSAKVPAKPEAVLADAGTLAPQDAPAPVTESAEARRDATAPEAEADMSAQVAEAPAVAQDQLAAGRAASGGLAVTDPAPFPEQRTRGYVIAPDATEVALLPEPDTEAYADAVQNPLKITAETPVSTFSIDVDTASYAVVRSSLMQGYLPPQEAVRIEEMVNYFPYAYPAPDATGAPFRPGVSLMPTPWNPDTTLVHIAIQGRQPALEDRPALNLVFLIDTSGSMEDANKLPLLKQSFRLMLGQLRPEDRVAIVTYAGSAGQVLAPTPASDQAAILAALENLSAGGSTAGQEGLQQAYAVAAGMAEQGEVTRVILATDGDFNVGLSDPAELKRFIADKRKTGTYLSVLGFGRGNLDDATMQALAQEGNGQAAYIDTLAEAQKVLVDQLTGALFPIADDVKIQVEWNPATVAEYRLIGYETRALNREDFNNDRVDAGEIGAGTSVTAIYEITPVGSPAQLSDPLRYQTEAGAAAAGDELGFLKLRYKEPGAADSILIETPIRTDGATASGEARFAAAIAGFGELLTASPYLRNWSYTDAIALATGAKGADPYGYRAEAVTLMRLAETLSR